MLVSPGTFYRGGALLMASDLAGTPDSGLAAQLCGDAHLMNFGLFQSPERRLVFDINDFDETLPGPWEWDVKRLAASFEIAARDHGFAAPTRRSIVLHSVRAYREGMLEMAEKRAIDALVHAARGRPDPELRRRAGRQGRQADGQGHVARGDEARPPRARRLTTEVEGRTRLRSDPPLLVPARELLEGDERARFTHAVEEALRNYRETLPRDRRAAYDLYRYRDMARKVVGVGSVGTRAWVLLFFGRDEDDPLFLQAKQAQALGAGALRRAQPVPQRRSARGRGPAADAGGRATSCSAGTASPGSTAGPTTSTCASSGTARARSTSRR